MRYAAHVGSITDHQGTRGRPPPGGYPRRAIRLTGREQDELIRRSSVGAPFSPYVEGEMRQAEQRDDLADRRKRAADARDDAAHALDRQHDALDRLSDELDHRDFLALLEAQKQKRRL
jgi:hypothetical protein